MAGRAGRRPGQSWDRQKPSQEPALAAAGPSDREDTAGGGGQSPCQLARPRECRAREAASLGSPQGPTASRPRGKGTRRGSRGGRSRKVCPPGGSGRGEDTEGSQEGKEGDTMVARTLGRGRGARWWQHWWERVVAGNLSLDGPPPEGKGNEKGGKDARDEVERGQACRRLRFA